MNDSIIMFWDNVEKTKTCWNWKGSTDKTGLPIIRIGSSKLGNFTEVSSRRLSLKLMGATLDAKEKVKAICQNKLCVNPEHLLAGDTARFWAKVQKLSGDDACWIWTAGTDKNGYGKFKIRKDCIQADQRAHRYSWSLLTGRPIPDGLVVCHKCDKPMCVNPSHLFLGTNLDNQTDCVEKGRKPHGSNHYAAKLTEKIVRKIRELSETGMSQTQLSKQFNLSQSYISQIVRRKKWKRL